MGYEIIKLAGERVWRTYLGGKLIDRLHDRDGADSHFPEEWMYSVVSANNAGREEFVEGICHVEQTPELTLKQLIDADPCGMLGEAHVKQWGGTPGVLVKMIDSMERLTIQVHPDKEKARKLFHSEFGKTECWHILGTRELLEEPACIYLGFKPGITRQAWIECFEQQDYDRMLSLLNCIPVRAGDTYLVRGGMPHAIGAGCLLIEIQEPTDYTIRVEKVTPSGFTIDDRMCHQGIGFEKMFDCFDYTGRSMKEVTELSLIVPKEIQEFKNIRQQLVGYEDTPCFRMEKMILSGKRIFQGEQVFSCLYVLSGEGRCISTGQQYNISQNDQFFVPAGADEYSLQPEEGKVMELLRLYGPSTEKKLCANSVCSEKAVQKWSENVKNREKNKCRDGKTGGVSV